MYFDVNDALQDIVCKECWVMLGGFDLAEEAKKRVRQDADMAWAASRWCALKIRSLPSGSNGGWLGVLLDFNVTS